MTLKNNRAPLLSIIKLYASFQHHMWIHTRVTVRKRLIWVLTSVTLTFDLWPWPFAWTSLLSLVITPESFMMIWWWEHGEKGVTDRRTDGQTDRQTDGLNQSYSCLVAAKNQSSTSLTFVRGKLIATYHNKTRIFAYVLGNPLYLFIYIIQSWHRFSVLGSTMEFEFNHQRVACT